MDKFSKMFKRKKKDPNEIIESDDFVTTDSNSLKNMTNSQLTDIIFRYDTELKNIYATIDDNKMLNSEIKKLSEENELY